GLVEALKILKDIEGIGVVELGRKDIVRHKLVTRIVNAYEKFDKDKQNKDNNESINKD
ncbi:MAG: PhoH family protein, partial [Prevotella sp.]|nr:PhoH family protein [Prevotella sp.]